MSKNKVGVAIIGVGAQGSGVHVPSCMENEHCDLIAVVDKQQKKLDRVAEKYNIPYKLRDYQSVKDMDEVEAVIIALPNYLHAPVAIEMLEAGKHVLVEKPIALNANQVEDMIKARDDSGKLLLVGQNNRFRPVSIFMKKYIESGKCGEIYSAEASWWRRRCGQRGWFIDKKRSGGGALVDIGVHAIDLAWWLMGSPEPEYVLGNTYEHFGDVISQTPTIYGDYEPDTEFSVDDTATGFVKFKNGATLSLGAAWASNIKDRGISIVLRGSKAGMTLDDKNGLQVYEEWQNELMDVTPNLSTQGSLHDHYFSCIRIGEKVIPSAENGLVIMKILDAIYESAANNKPVEINL